jgi:hypothetical protein
MLPKKVVGCCPRGAAQSSAVQLHFWKGVQAMDEDTTRRMPGFEERVMTELARVVAELAANSSRLSALEDKVDARLRETRPLWEGIKEQLDRVESKLDIFAHDTSALLLETRTDIAQVTKPKN